MKCLRAKSFLVIILKKNKTKQKKKQKKKKKHHSWCDLRLLSIDRNYAPTGLVVDKGLLCRQ